MARGDNMSNKPKDEKMDAKEAFETLFGFDLTDFDDVFDNSYIGNLCRTLEEARKVKKAYERLNEDFSWNINLHIYKYKDGFYSVEDSDQFVQYGDVEKIE